MYSLYEEDSSFNKDYTNGTAVRHVRHANIVQRVKIRYKIKLIIEFWFAVFTVFCCANSINS